MTGNLFNALQRSKDNNEIISIWNYNDDDGFWSGYVKDFNDDMVSIQHFTKYGKPDGTIIVRMTDIKTIDFDDDYSKAMQCVIDYSAELDKEEKFETTLPDNNMWQFAVLKQVENNANLISKVEINGGEHFSGFIENVTESDFLLRCIGSLGEPEAKAIYKLDDVSAVRINDIEGRKRLMLYKWRQARL